MAKIQGITIKLEEKDIRLFEMMLDTAKYGILTDPHNIHTTRKEKEEISGLIRRLSLRSGE